MPNFIIVPEKECVLISPKFGILEKCCEIQVFRKCDNKDGCIVTFPDGCVVTEKVGLSLVKMILFNQCHFNNFLWIGLPLKISRFL